MSAHITILVAEDDADDRFLLQAAFQEAKIEVNLQFAENGFDVMSQLHQSKNKLDFPKLMLLDLNMPKKDGREVLREVKSSVDYSKIPIIVFSTTNNKQEIERCYALGANHYIIKPDNFTDLLNVVAEIHSKWLYINDIRA